MDYDLIPNATLYKKRRRLRKQWQKVLSVLGCLVVFCTTYALILPAITQERETFCGMEAHSHSKACYTESVVSELICSISEEGGHVHDDGCYVIEGGHAHGESCYASAGGHTHGESCYTSEGGHTHGSDCSVSPAATPMGMAATNGWMPVRKRKARPIPTRKPAVNRSGIWYAA